MSRPSGGSYAPDTTKQQQKQIYRLRNVRTGYVLYRALVFVHGQKSLDTEVDISVYYLRIL